MKRIIILMLNLSLAANIVYGQDLITRRNGQVVKARVKKIGTREIEYNIYDNPDGPRHTLLITDVTKINYENGTIDTFDLKDYVKPKEYSNEMSLWEQGGYDAKKYFKGQQAFYGGLASGALVIGYGWIPAYIIGRTPPRYDHLNFPDPSLMDNRDYREAYMTKAFQIKKHKTREGFALGCVAVIVVAISVSVALSAGTSR